MERETLVDNEFITMWYYPHKKIVHHVIHRYICGEPFRSALNRGVETLRAHRAHKRLSDDRSYAAVSKEDTEWGMAVWVPQAVSAGWRHWAIVVPKSVIGQMSYRQMIDYYQSIDVSVKVFDDAEKGMAWLEDQ
jgi:hypothetical protein